jgi:predicted DNA-binding transcriptional regulator YafY
MLQARGRVTGAELAQRLGVDRRTVRRYIAMLEELGIPITSELGRAGGYLLVAGYKLPPLLFTDDEAWALAIGLLAARGLGLSGAAEAVASAQAKLERVMPPALKSRVRAADEAVSLDGARTGEAVDGEVLASLALASQQQRRVRFAYRSRHQATERDVDPYGLAHRTGHWYVVGMCHLRRGLRSFRIDRVESVRVLAASFIRPPGFDTLGHLDRSLATIPREFSAEVLLLTDPVTAGRQIFPALGILEPHFDGVLLRAEVENLDWLARELARLPFDFRIERPAALREAIATIGKRLLHAAQSTTHRTANPPHL